MSNSEVVLDELQHCDEQGSSEIVYETTNEWEKELQSLRYVELKRAGDRKGGQIIKK